MDGTAGIEIFCQKSGPVDISKKYAVTFDKMRAYKEP